MTLPRFAAVFALAWCALLAPIQSGIWNAQETPVWIAGLTALHSAADVLYATFAGTEPRYDFFGRLFTLTYAGIFIAVAAQPVGARIAHGLLCAALIAAGTGDVIAYWLAGIGNAPLRAIGFWYTEVPALLAAALAMAAVGVSMARAGAAAGYLLVLTPLTLLAATAAVRYMPHGPAFGLALGAAIMAWQSSRTSAQAHEPHDRGRAPM